MVKSVKELLRLDKSGPDINFSRLMLVVLPMLLALIVSLASMNLASENVLAAVDRPEIEVIRTVDDYAPSHELIRTDVVERPESNLIRTDSANRPDNNLIRTVAGNSADVVVIRASTDSMDVKLVRN